MHRSRRTYVPLFLQTVEKHTFQSHSPLLVLSTTEKHYKFFGFPRLFDLNMETHFKTTWRKRLRIPSRTNLRWYLVHHPRLRTLPSRKQTSLWRPAQQEYTSQGAPTYPYFSNPSKIYISVSPVPFWSCLHQKNTTSFSDLQDWFEHENTFQSSQAKKATYVIQNAS